MKLREPSDIAVSSLVLLHLGRVQAFDLNRPNKNAEARVSRGNEIEADIALWEVDAPAGIAHQAGDVEFGRPDTRFSPVQT